MVSTSGVSPCIFTFNRDPQQFLHEWSLNWMLGNDEFKIMVYSSPWLLFDSELSINT